LIGPPAIGKGGYVDKVYGKENKGITYELVNRDDVVNDVVGSPGGVGTYDAKFLKPNAEPGPEQREFLGIEDFQVLKHAPVPEDMSDPETVKQYVSTIVNQAQQYNIKNKDGSFLQKLGKVEILPWLLDGSTGAPKGDAVGAIINFSKLPFFPRIKDKFSPVGFSNVEKTEADVATQFDAHRTAIAKGDPESNVRKDVIIDMMNMSKGERDMHRQFFVAAIEGIENVREADASKISDYYDQEAVVFAAADVLQQTDKPDVYVYKPEIQSALIKRARQREEEIRKKGEEKKTKASKSIPDHLYKRTIELPPGEFPTELKFVGIRHWEQPANPTRDQQ